MFPAKTPVTLYISRRNYTEKLSRSNSGKKRQHIVSSLSERLKLELAVKETLIKKIYPKIFGSLVITITINFDKILNQKFIKQNE